MATSGETDLTYFERAFFVPRARSRRRNRRPLLSVRLASAVALTVPMRLIAPLVLTHVSRDHVHILGATEREIAPEKLAIARTGTPLFIAPQTTAAEAAIASTLIATADIRRPTPYRGTLGLAGDHQRDNAGTVLAVAAWWLRDDFMQEQAEYALANAAFIGRSQHAVLPSGDAVLLDGAHHDQSLAACPRHRAENTATTDAYLSRRGQR